MEKKLMTGDELFGFSPNAPANETPPTESSKEGQHDDSGAPGEPLPPGAAEPPPGNVKPLGEEPGKPEEPPATKPVEKPAEPAEPAFDFASHFGEKYKSPEEIKGVLTNYDTIIQENETLKAAVEKTQNPFADDTAYRFNALVAKKVDPKIAFRLASLTQESVEQMSAQEVIALQEMAEMPEMIPMERDLMDEINYRYDTTVLQDTDDYDYSPEQIEESKRKAKRNELLLAKDAAKARKALLELSKVDPLETKDPVAAIKEEQQQTKQLEESWGQIAPKFVEQGFQEIPIYQEVKNEETGKTEYQELTKFKLNQEQLKGFDKEIQQMAVAGKVPLDQDGMRALYSQAYASLLTKHHAAITSAIVSFVKGQATQNAEKEFYRSESPATPPVHKPTADGQELSKEERIKAQGEKLFPQRSGRRF